MTWQDAVFLAGGVLTVVVLAPAMRDRTARLPRATSFPKMALALVYALAFLTLGMTAAAVGSLSVGAIWLLLGLYRSSSSTEPDADPTIEDGQDEATGGLDPAGDELTAIRPGSPPL